MPENNRVFSVEGQKKGDVTLCLFGRIGLENFDALLRKIQELFAEYNPASLTIDLEKVDYLDSTGALFSVAQSFNSTAMVYKPQQNRLDSYPYSRWRVNPGDMVSDFLLRDIRKSLLFKGVFS